MSDTVSSLTSEDSVKFLVIIINEFKSVCEAWSGSLQISPGMQSIRGKDCPTVDDIPFLDSVLNSVSIRTKQCENSEACIMIGNINDMSKACRTYESETDVEEKTRLFSLILQMFADNYAHLVRIRCEYVPFILNLITKNGFIKFIRDARYHNNVVLDSLSYSIHDSAMSNYLHERDPQLYSDVIAHKRFILFYSQNVLVEENLYFLKKILSICHIQLFVLGLVDRIVVSEDVLEKCWIQKYPLLKCLTVEKIPIETHEANMLENKKQFKTSGFGLPY